MNGIKDSQLHEGQIIELQNGADLTKFIALIVKIYRHGLPAQKIPEPIKYKGNKLFLGIKIINAENLTASKIKNINKASYYHSWYVTKIFPYNPSRRRDKIKWTPFNL